GQAHSITHIILQNRLMGYNPVVYRVNVNQWLPWLNSEVAPALAVEIMNVYNYCQRSDKDFNNGQGKL
ncbi:MAG: hypothetical protein ACRDE5_15440, partial [Ginsengibacter sp.]